MKTSRWTPRPLAAAGFTMIEMLIVVALIGIVATIAIPNFKYSVRKSREAVLREDLWVLRDVIDQYHTDKGVYPPSLEELVSAGYIRRIPVDPITQSADTWVTTTEPLAEDESLDDAQAQEPGITDVRSGAEGVALDGTNYQDW